MSSDKKILLVTFSDNADHQEVVYSLFEELLKTCDVYALGKINPKVPYLNSNKIYLVNAPLRPGICKGTFNVLELLKIICLVYKEKFDVVYFETLHVWNIAVWMFHPAKTKIIQAIHDVDPHEGDKSLRSVELINKLATKLTDVILLRNSLFVERLKNKYGVPKDKIKILDPWRRFPEYKNIIFSHRALFFGRINNYKGVEYLYDIINSCPNIHFDIVGRVEPSEYKRVEKLRDLPNVNLDTNYVTDSKMQDYFYKADFVILPYKSASQSGVILDANKFGRPAIAFDVGAIKYQIKNNVNGILVKSGDVDGFIKAVKTLSDYGKKALSDFSRSTYEYGFERYSSKSAKEKFIKMINER